MNRGPDSSYLLYRERNKGTLSKCFFSKDKNIYGFTVIMSVKFYNFSPSNYFPISLPILPFTVLILSFPPYLVHTMRVYTTIRVFTKVQFNPVQN